MKTQDPRINVAKTIFVITAFFMAMYIIFSYHMAHVHAQSKHDTKHVIVDAGVASAGAREQKDPFEFIDIEDAIGPDPLTGLTDAGTSQEVIDYHYALDNPYYKKGYNFVWRPHNEYEYFVWLETDRRPTKKELEQREYNKIIIQREITTAVMYNLVHCVRTVDNVGVLHPACTGDANGCNERVSAIVGYIVDVAYELNLDPWLLAAVALYESSFNPYAVSDTGAVGVFQINPNIPLAKGIKFIHSNRYRNWCKNQIGNCQKEIVEAAAVHFYKDVKHCNDNVRQALTRYNTGRCTINGRIRKSYVKAVFRNQARLLKVRPEVPWCDPNRSGKTDEYYL